MALERAAAGGISERHQRKHSMWLSASSIRRNLENGGVASIAADIGIKEEENQAWRKEGVGSAAKMAASHDMCEMAGQRQWQACVCSVTV